MKKIWVTYAWSDNEEADVDYVAQELQTENTQVNIDKYKIGAGRRLWEQIDKFITDPEECDAWVFFMTGNSLQSEACREELAYALNRALSTRHGAFPIIGLTPDTFDTGSLPAAIRTRLGVSLIDPDWVERIVAEVEGRQLSVRRPRIEPYFLRVHQDQPVETHYKQIKIGGEMRNFGAPVTFGQPIAIEVRPRAGVWGPFIAAIPFTEKAAVNPSIVIGHAGQPTLNGSLVFIPPQRQGNKWVMAGDDQATPTRSYFIWCDRLPSTLLFGQSGGPNFTERF